MTVLLTLLLAGSPALAGKDKPHRDSGEKKVVGPPLRIGGYAAIRGGVTSAGGVELNSQIAGEGRFGLDLGFAASTLQRVDNFEPLRQYATFALLGDGVYAVSDALSVGPAVALTFRPYTQEWDAVGGTWVPMAGVRATSGLLTARTWQLHLTVKGSVDLVQTRLVFATSEVRQLSPMELQIGLRWLFARQRSPIVLEAETRVAEAENGPE